MTNISQQAWSERLLHLGLVVQRRVYEQVTAATSLEQLAASTGEIAGDRIYAIDRVVEELLLEEIAAWPTDCLPLLLIAEGLGTNGRMRLGPEHEPIKFRVLIDPIDGTRMLMYDKRSAWFLAAVAEDRGEETSLAGTFASVVVELPPSKQTKADCFAAIRGSGVHGWRVDVSRRDRVLDMTPISVQPSTRIDLRDGFVSVVSYFPGIKVLAAELAEQIALADPQLSDAPNLFDDQYISTGGQLVQLLTGRDRCVIDLRPLMARSPRCRSRVMCAHPYDLAGLLVAQEAGVIVTDGYGMPLDAPLDVTTDVHWCGYANAGLQQLVEPIVRSSGVLAK